MATIRRFEDLEVWQLARELNKAVIPLLASLQISRNFEIKAQLEDALGSSMDNIAEGFERDGTREFIQFLSMSKGSLGESRSQLYRILDKGLITSNEFDQLQKQCLVLASKIANFMTYLRNLDHRGNKFRKPDDLA